MHFELFVLSTRSSVARAFSNPSLPAIPVNIFRSSLARPASRPLALPHPRSQLHEHFVSIPDDIGRYLAEMKEQLAQLVEWPEVGCMGCEQAAWRGEGRCSRARGARRAVWMVRPEV